MVIEIICFYILSKFIGGRYLLWIIPLLYDCLAFMPQGLIGYLSDKYPKLKVGLIGSILAIISLILFEINANIFLVISILCMGNAFIHIDGAEITLRNSNGKLSDAAIFVAGGSFGVFMGKYLGSNKYSYLLILLIGITLIPTTILGDTYRKLNAKNECRNYNYANKKMDPMIIVLLATLVVMVRGYMGYGIPTSWNKTTLQSIMLYSFMGVGKILGGVFIDKIGMKKTAYISVLGALPFLCFGDKIMVVSLIGVMLFSMTMAVTLGLIVSVLKEKPGVAFGYTTIGLFLGTVPIFFFKFTTVLSNCVLISILSIVCILILNKIIGGTNE